MVPFFSGDWDVHWGYGILTHGKGSFPIWVWLKIIREGQTAGFGPCFHLPGQAIRVPVF